MLKAVVICSLVVFANAGLLPSHEEAYEVHAPAQYDFSYSVHDGHTGDVKQQQESRRGDAVSGSYSLIEPDGHKRVVHYQDDGHSGFNAVVEREGTIHHQPVAVAHAAPVAVAHAAPVAVAHAAPVAVAHAPVAVAHSSPAYLSHAQVSHQSYSAPLVQAHAAPLVQAHAAPFVQAHAAPFVQAHAAPLVQAHAVQPLAIQQQQQLVGYAGQGYVGHASGYSTISQVTHHGHGGYHH